MKRAVSCLVIATAAVLVSSHVRAAGRCDVFRDRPRFSIPATYLELAIQAEESTPAFFPERSTVTQLERMMRAANESPLRNSQALDYVAAMARAAGHAPESEAAPNELASRAYQSLALIMLSAPNSALRRAIVRTIPRFTRGIPNSFLGQVLVAMDPPGAEGVSSFDARELLEAHAAVNAQAPGLYMSLYWTPNLGPSARNGIGDFLTDTGVLRRNPRPSRELSRIGLRSWPFWP